MLGMLYKFLIKDAKIVDDDQDGIQQKRGRQMSPDAQEMVDELTGVQPNSKVVDSKAGNSGKKEKNNKNEKKRGSKIEDKPKEHSKAGADADEKSSENEMSFQTYEPGNTGRRSLSQQ